MKIGKGTNYMTSKYAYFEKSVQTDQEILFEYILAFLKVIEDRISSGALTQELQQRHKDLDQNRLNQLMEQSREKLRELKKILGKIASLRNGKGGDVFFRGLAKTF